MDSEMKNTSNSDYTHCTIVVSLECRMNLFVCSNSSFELGVVLGYAYDFEFNLNSATL